VRLIGETELDLSGRAVLLVDDIVDTGRTLLYARDLIREKKTSSVVTLRLSTNRAAARLQLTLFSCANGAILRPARRNCSILVVGVTRRRRGLVMRNPPLAGLTVQYIGSTNAQSASGEEKFY
jgi:hypothetical protein